MQPAITGLGMISPLGRDVVTSCAALRAGLTRPTEITYYQVVEGDDAVGVPVIGHTVQAYTEGFYFTGRWLRLLRGGLLDLFRYAKLPPPSDRAFWQKTGLMVVMPVIDDRYMLSEAPGSTFFQQYVLQRLLDYLGLAQVLPLAEFVPGGHSGTITAIRHAAQYLERSPAMLERCIVLAADSYVEPTTLGWLARYHRLKMPNAPSGLQPGEAGACFMLETVASARRRGGTIEALVASVALAQEANHFFAEEPNQGRGLSQALYDCLAVLASDGPFYGDIITDFNGEVWRAYELGTARVRLGAERIDADARTVAPCVGTGDTGSASGAVGICVAVRSLVRGYAQNNQALILSSSDNGQVGAACIAKA